MEGKVIHWFHLMETSGHMQTWDQVLSALKSQYESSVVGDGELRSIGCDVGEIESIKKADDKIGTVMAAVDEIHSADLNNKHTSREEEKGLIIQRKVEVEGEDRNVVHKKEEKMEIASAKETNITLPFDLEPIPDPDLALSFMLNLVGSVNMKVDFEVPVKVCVGLAPPLQVNDALQLFGEMSKRNVDDAFLFSIECFGKNLFPTLTTSSLFKFCYADSLISKFYGRKRSLHLRISKSLRSWVWYSSTFQVGVKLSCWQVCSVVSLEVHLVLFIAEVLVLSMIDAHMVSITKFLTILGMVLTEFFDVAMRLQYDGSEVLLKGDVWTVEMVLSTNHLHCFTGEFEAAFPNFETSWVLVEAYGSTYQEIKGSRED